MNRVNRIVAQVGTAGFIALLPCLAGEAIGQTAPGGGRGRQSEINLPQNPLSAPTPLYTVKFDGGTVQDYLEALRAGSNGAPLNVACAKELMREKIDAINLEQVSLLTALNAIGAASNEPLVRWDVQPLDSGAIESASGAMRAFKLVQQRADSKWLRGSEVKTFSLREYVGETRGDEAVKRATTLISAAEAALGIDDKGEPTWVVKFHPDSGLLIVRGTPDDLAVASQVVTQLVSEKVAHEQIDRRREIADSERARAMDVAAKMAQQADGQRRAAAELALHLQKKFEAGEKDVLGELQEAGKRAQEAEEEYSFRRNQYRRIEEQATFQGLNQQATAASAARIQELEAMVEKLQKQVQELQQALSRTATGGSRSK